MNLNRLNEFRHGDPTLAERSLLVGITPIPVRERLFHPARELRYIGGIQQDLARKVEAEKGGPDLDIREGDGMADHDRSFAA